jgi:hypothetical protein
LFGGLKKMALSKFARTFIPKTIRQWAKEKIEQGYKNENKDVPPEVQDQLDDMTSEPNWVFRDGGLFSGIKGKLKKVAVIVVIIVVIVVIIKVAISRGPRALASGIFKRLRWPRR